MAANGINQRPNYFAGQYLLEDDFQLEQNYQIDREQRHNRLLHVAGIAEGLNVAPVKEGGLKVTVSPGTAVDKQGQQIILLNQRTVDLPGNGEFTLVIKYAEKKDSLQEGTTDGYRRIVEEHVIDFAASDSSIALAKLTVTDEKITIDESIREYSGLRFPSAKDSQITLRSHGDQNPNFADLTGSLSISGKLAVTSHTQLDDTLTVKGNTTIEKELAVKSILLRENKKGVTLRSHGDENPNLAALTGSLSITGTLYVEEKTELNNTLTVKEETVLQKDLDVKGKLTVGSTTITNGIIQKGKPQITDKNSDLGLYSQDKGKALRFVTNESDFYFFSAGGYGDASKPTLKIDKDGNLTAKGKITGSNASFSGTATANGNVGIGLEVVGTIKATNIILTTNRQAQVRFWRSKLYTVEAGKGKGTQEMKMEAENSIPILLEVSGEFKGVGEKVWMATKDAHWYLYAKSDTACVHATAVCIGFNDIDISWKI